MTRDDMLTKLRDDRDAAADRGDLVEALILNDRIRDLKSGATSPAVAALTWKRPSVTLLDRRALFRCRQPRHGKSQGSFALNSMPPQSDARVRVAIGNEATQVRFCTVEKLVGGCNALLQF